MHSSRLWAAVCVLVSLSNLAAQQVSSTRLTGRVQDQTSAGIAGVVLRLLSLDRVLQTESRADGSFEFHNIPAGVYDMDISHPGFVKQQRHIDLRGDAVLPPVSIILEVGPMPDMETCGSHATLKYSPPSPAPSRLSGAIRDFESKTPVANARVTVSPAGKQPVTLETRSDKRGEFAFQNLPVGRYDVRISRPHYWSEDVKGLLLPRDNGVSIEVTILQLDRMIACQ